MHHTVAGSPSATANMLFFVISHNESFSAAPPEAACSKIAFRMRGVKMLVPYIATSKRNQVEEHPNCVRTVRLSAKSAAAELRELTRLELHRLAPVFAAPPMPRNMTL